MVGLRPVALGLLVLFPSLLALVLDLGLVPWGRFLLVVCLAPVVLGLSPLEVRPLLSPGLVPLRVRPAVRVLATPVLGLVVLVSLLLAFGLGTPAFGLAVLAEPGLEPEFPGTSMSIGPDPEPAFEGTLMSMGPDDPEKSISVPPTLISVSPGTARSMTSLTSDPAIPAGKAETSCKPRNRAKAIRWTVMIGC